MLKNKSWKALLTIILIIFIATFVIGCDETKVDKSTNTSPTTTKTVENITDKTISIKNNAVPKANNEKVTISTKGKLKIHYIDVGQADSILIQTPSKKNILIDAGNNNDSSKVINYLIDNKVKKLDYVIGTHPHEDHIGGLDSVIQTFTIGKVIMPKVTTTTVTFRDVISAIQSKKLKITESKPGTKLDLGPNITAQILAPNTGSYSDLNNYSVVLKLTYGKNSFLFDGDAEDISENEMLDYGYDLKADVLKVGHHGSSYSSSIPFLEKVSPKYAIISVGEGNVYGHPTQDTLDKLKSLNITTYRTDLNGTITVESDGKNLKISTLKKSIQPRAPTIKSTGYYIGNTSTKKFHRPTCSRLPYKNKIDLKMSRTKVIDLGYEPCKICNP